MSAAEAIPPRQAHEAFAKEINGEVWSLLDKGSRTPEQDEQMGLAAYASQVPWLKA